MRANLARLAETFDPERMDILLLMAPTTSSIGYAGRGDYAMLPDGALLVNVARGKLVDTDALVAELETGRIRAALDVTDPEPLPADHPLWRQPGALISPHVGGASSAFFPRADRLMAAQLARFRQHWDEHGFGWWAVELPGVARFIGWVDDDHASAGAYTGSGAYHLSVTGYNGQSELARPSSAGSGLSGVTPLNLRHASADGVAWKPAP